MSQSAQLAAGMTLLGLCPVPSCLDRLVAYTELLARWNRVHNLTQVAPGENTVSHHLLDSLSIAPHLRGTTVIDVGSGGGLPGIPLAICDPERQFTLLDSRGKKARFLEQVRIELALSNVVVVQSRVEHQAGSFDTITCRAFASLADISRLSAHLLAEDGRVLAMKGVLTSEEREDDLSPLVIDQIKTLLVPNLSAERNLVVMRRAQPGQGA